MKVVGLRVPDTLHKELLEEAKREGVSLNQLCLVKLARPLDWYRFRELQEEMVEKIATLLHHEEHEGHEEENSLCLCELCGRQ